MALDGDSDRSRMERLDHPRSYRYLSGEELRQRLNPTATWRVVDCGSGTGIYANEIAPIVEAVYAVDIDPEMQAYYRKKGIPPSVQPVTGTLEQLPFDSDALDGAFSIRSFHHGVAEYLDEVARVLRPGGRFIIVDWSRMASGLFDHDPNPEGHYDLSSAQSLLLDRNFRIRHGEQRSETFVIVAEQPPAGFGRTSC